MMIGAKSGLGLDQDLGLLTGSLDGIRLIIPANIGKLNIFFKGTIESKIPDVNELIKAFDGLDITNIEFINDMFCVTSKLVTASSSSADKVASLLRDLTKRLCDINFISDDKISVDDLGLSGKKISGIKGNTLEGYIFGILGGVIGATIAILIMYGLANYSFIFSSIAPTAILLLLPVLGFELGKGRKSVIGLAILLILLILTGETLVRLKTAAEAVYDNNAAAQLINAFASSLNIDEVREVTLSEVFWQLPSIFDARDSFLKDLVIVYVESFTILILSIVSYRKGNKSILDYLGWMYVSITGGNR